MDAPTSALAAPQTPPPSAGAESAADRLAFVDLLRGLAILGVVAVHTRQYWFAEIPVWFRDSVDLGRYGVDLFFIVSAFTLARSCRRNSLGGFFLRRWFRIAPIYYLGIAIYGLIPWLAGWSQAPAGSRVIANLAFLNGWIPGETSGLVPGGWSISAEIAFYLLLPFAVTRLASLRHAILLYGSALLVVVGLAGQTPAWLTAHGASPSAVKDFMLYCPLWHLPTFALGLVLYYARPLVRASFAWPLILAGVATFLCAPVTVERWQLPRSFAVSAPLFAVALGVAALGGGFRAFPGPWLRRLGTISYSVYLMHFWVLETVVALVIATLVPYEASTRLMLGVSFAATLLLTTGVALLSRRYIEEPALRISDRLRGRNRRQAPPAVGAGS